MIASNSRWNRRKACKGCTYQKRAFGQENYTYCGYIEITGFPRGCPAGEGCIRYAKEQQRYSNTISDAPNLQMDIWRAIAITRENHGSASHFDKMIARSNPIAKEMDKQ